MGITDGRLPHAPIAITARAPLWTGGVEAAGYGLYSYLLFGSSGEAGYQRRLTAACAYLSVLQDTEETTIREQSPRSINIFYVPLRGASFRREAITTQDAAWLVANYDYARARLLLNRIGEDGDDVYLVSYQEALTTIEMPQPGRLLVQDLSLVPPELIELWIEEFRRQVRRQEYWDELTFRQAMLRLRSALPYVARYVAFFGAATGLEFPKPAVAAPNPPATGIANRCGARSATAEVNRKAN
jgi:hypothetical protein